MAGTTMVASELSPEISATIQLEGESAEWDYLKAVRKSKCTRTLSGAVGFNTLFRLRNPPDSGVIAVVDQVSMSNIQGSAALTIAAGQELGDLATLATTVTPDRRWGIGVNTATLIFSMQNTVAAGPSGDEIANSVRGVNEEWLYRSEIVVLPGTTVNWGTAIGTTDRGLAAYATWKERALPLIERL